MRDLRKAESLVQAFWVLVWMPLVALFGFEWLFKALPFWPAFVAFLYGMFLPALVWLFIAEPLLRNKR